MSAETSVALVVEADDTRILVWGPGLGLYFTRSTDRWTHGLRLGEPGQPADSLLVASVLMEGEARGADSGRVLSPVFQEVQIHNGPGLGSNTICLLLTGHWFRHHFSAAISMTLGGADGNTVAIDFDIADRCRDALDSLASTYVVGMPSSELVEASPHAIAWSGGPLGAGRLTFRGEFPARVALAEAGRRASRVQALATLNQGDQTHRLAYGWRWESSGSRT